MDLTIIRVEIISASLGHFYGVPLSTIRGPPPYDENLQSRLGPQETLERTKNVWK